MALKNIRKQGWENKNIALIIVLVAVNLLLKGIFLSANSLGGDEPFSVYHAQMDVNSIIRLLSEGNNPPLYEIILHYWMKLWGISTFSVRFPSLLFSSFTAYYIYRIGHQFLNNRIAITATIIFIFSNYHIVFAHEARVYSLVGMLSAMSMFYFFSVLRNLHAGFYQINKPYDKWVIKDTSLLLAANIFLIYAHYFGFFILILQLLFIAGNKKILITYWKGILLCTGILLVFYAPNVATFANRFWASSAGTWLTPPNGLNDLYNMIRQFSNTPVTAVAVISVLLLALIKYIVKRKNENPHPYYLLVILWFVLIFFFMFGISFYIPMFLDRYLMPAAIAFVLVIAIAVDYLAKSFRLKLIIPSIICMLFIVTVKPNISNKRNVEATVNKIKEIKNNHTAVLICPQHFILNFVYYYNIELFKNYHTTDIYSKIDRALRAENIYAVNSIHNIDIEKWNHVIYLDAAADFSFPDNKIKPTLDKHYHLSNAYEFYEIFKVFEYLK